MNLSCSHHNFLTIICISVPRDDFNFTVSRTQFSLHIIFFKDKMIRAATESFGGTFTIYYNNSGTWNFSSFRNSVTFCRSIASKIASLLQHNLYKFWSCALIKILAPNNFPGSRKLPSYDRNKKVNKTLCQICRPSFV